MSVPAPPVAAPAIGRRVPERPAARALRSMTIALLGPRAWPAAGVAGQLALLPMAVSIAILLFGVGVVSIRGLSPEGVFGNDFVAYYAAAQIIADGRLRDLYDPNVQTLTQRAVLESAGSTSLGLNMYANPPLWAAMLVPLLPVGVLGGFWLWRVMTLVVSLATLLLIAAKEGHRDGWVRATVLLLCFFPFAEAWNSGQMSALMLVAFGGWFTLSRMGRSRAAGAILSLAVLKPQYLPLIAIYLLWKRQWRQLQGLIAGTGLQLALTGALFVSSGQVPAIDGLMTFGAPGGAQTSAFVERQVKARALVSHVQPSVDPRTQLATVAGITIVCVGGFLYLCGNEWKPRTRSFVWEVLALNALTAFTAYHNHLATLYLLLPPLVALLVVANDEVCEPRWATPLLACLIAVPSMGFLIGPFEGPYFFAGWITMVGAIVLGLRVSRYRAPVAARSPGIESGSRG